MSKYVIAVDAMGGDNAPEAIVAGAQEALRQFSDIRILLAGRREVLNGAEDERISIVDAREKIEMDESPMFAIRKKPDSSLVRALMEMREGRAHAVVSAGSTGALLAGGMFKVGRIPGIDRPALAPVIPGIKGPVMLIDAGANVDCQPRFLNQFGLMGSAYMKGVLEIENPRVGLANIGTEAEKGNKLSKETYELMRMQESYIFSGNVEAREIISGESQVIVLDGFDGNLILKYTEGLASAMGAMLKEELLRDVRSKFGALFIMPALKRFKARMDYHEYGGAPLLGVEGALVKAHGASDARAIRSAIGQARNMIKNDVVGKIRAGVAGLTAANDKGD